MKQAFQIYNAGSRLWPMKVFKKENQQYAELKSLKDIKEYLEAEEVLYVQEIGTYGQYPEEKMRQLKMKNISAIQGPIRYAPSSDLTLDDVLSLSEAAKLWGLSTGAAIRNAIDKDKFYESEVRKADNVWLITYAGMQRVFDAITREEETTVPTEYFQEIVYDKQRRRFIRKADQAD